MLNPGEMGLKDAAEVEAILKGIPGYVEGFKKAFPEAGDNAVTFDNFALAVGAFERKLVTPSPWDKFLGGDTKALTEEQQKGARVFVETGCISCHTGQLMGGKDYKKLGLIKPWPRTEDIGRMKVTNKEEDKYFFKVPSLRNIAKTGPYFHDGKTADLTEAVKLMARHQLAKELSDADAKLIVAFLGSLTGKLDPELTKKPDLPKKLAAPVTPAAAQ